ncbi:hypothetical protein [Streptomyces ziwulingensis]|uniref:Membrane protein n=1 Tax=Streptomyces ziwulingensis TaxID=1045501 RepID=A0ABP9BHA5_9ACTN
MHMNSVPQYLLSEDRQDFERVLNEALRSAPHRPELAAMGQRLNPEQLRTMALSATALITTAAAAEYQYYVRVREELRQPVAADPRSSAPGPGSPDSDANAVGFAAAMGEVAETTGAGAVAVVAVLAPVLAGTAAAIFLLVGYVLRMLEPEPALARTIVTTGWVFGAVTAIAILVAGVGLLSTALRNRPSAEATAYGERDGEVREAREAWREALLERGIVPFLRDALADPGASALPGRAPATPASRMPTLGYDRPGFTSPDNGSAGPRPSYTSPDFSSPDFGGPENRPD